VFYLDLSQNNITQVESRTFEGLLQLQLLNLTENRLYKIPNEAFKGYFIFFNNFLFKRNLEG